MIVMMVMVRGVYMERGLFVGIEVGRERAGEAE